MIRSPAELLIHELSAIQDAETQASRALQDHLSLVENGSVAASRSRTDRVHVGAWRDGGG